LAGSSQTLFSFMDHSPGFLKDDFMTYFNETSVRRGDTVLIQNKSKFLRVPASSGYKNAVEQILASNEIRSQMTELKAVNEVSLIELLPFIPPLLGSRSRAILCHTRK
jgi:hypothetical protein